MSQYYSDPSFEDSPTKLPDIEVFHMSHVEIREAEWTDGEGDALEAGWYWWCCLPGCMPDSSPYGPFSSEDMAVEDMRENFGF
jgi:hypothetical protein